MPLLDVWMHHHICDVNFDGNITAADITAVYDFLLSDIQNYGEHLDTDFDGEITASDITNIYNHLLND